MSLDAYLSNLRGTGLSVFGLFPADDVGAPTGGGPFALGELWLDSAGDYWVCTVAGSPGTWEELRTSGSGTPADTVESEETFGLADDPGMADEYSRGDHTHGSPINPVTAHEVAGDPHPGYALEANAVLDGDAAGGVLGGTYPDPGFAVDMATQAELNTHEAASDPHPGYLTPAEHTAIGDGSPHHAAMTLAADADTLLGLSVQELTLDTQAANLVLAGPTSGGAADPAFRALVAADIPAAVRGFWPGPGKLKIGGAEYSTAAAAFAAAVSGDTILVGVGEFTCDNQTLPAGVNLFGLDPYRSILKTSAATRCLTLSAVCRVGNLSFQNTFSSSSRCSAIYCAASTVALTQVLAMGTNPGAGYGLGFELASGTEIELFNCGGSGSKTRDLYIYGGATAVRVYGGSFGAGGFAPLDSDTDIGAGLIRFIIPPYFNSISWNTPPRGLLYNTGLQLIGGAALTLTNSVTLISLDGTFASNSDSHLASLKATKTYMDAHINDTVDAHDASAISTDTATFNNSLSAADDTVQKALDTLDNTTVVVRNYIINPLDGVMSTWGRGNSITSATIPANSDGNYAADRWVLLSDGNNIAEVSQQTASPPTGSSGFHRLLVSTANKKFGILQIIDSLACIPLRDKVISFSILAKTTAAAIGNIRIGILEWTGTANSPTKDVVSAWSVAGTNPTLVTNWAYKNTPANLGLTTSWQLFKVEGLTLGSTLTNLGVFVWSDDTTTTINDIVDLSQAWLHLGLLSLPFLSRQPEEERSMCKQSFQRIGNGVWGRARDANNIDLYPTWFPMRATPTLVLNDTTPDMNVNFGTITGSGSTAAFNRASDVAGSIFLTGFTGMTANHPVIGWQNVFDLSAEIGV